MKEKPILFSGPMVRAILDGRKTQTRRIIKPQPERREAVGGGIVGLWWSGWNMDMQHFVKNLCPYGHVGDSLWVRETFSADPLGGWGCPSRYRADTGAVPFDGMKWKPSIFMPRWASRLTLEITGIRVERLQDISASDVVSEGTPCVDTNVRGILVQNYRELWESINGEGSWAVNPWVWVVEFKKVPQLEIA